MTDLAHLPPLTEEALAKIRVFKLAEKFAEMSIDPPSLEAIHTWLKGSPDSHDEWRELNEAQGS